MTSCLDLISLFRGSSSLLENVPFTNVLGRKAWWGFSWCYQAEFEYISFVLWKLVVHSSSSVFSTFYFESVCTTTRMSPEDKDHFFFHLLTSGTIIFTLQTLKKCLWNKGKVIFLDMATHPSIPAWRIPWREAWWATVQRGAKSWTRLEQLSVQLIENILNSQDTIAEWSGRNHLLSVTMSNYRMVLSFPNRVSLKIKLLIDHK